jgi:hypothetical protein
VSEYRLTADDSGVVRTVDNAFIPNDPANRDWIAYQAWLAAGNKPDPHVPPPEFFPIISDRQFFQALAMAGAITQDEALAAVQTGGIPEVMQTYIDSITDPDKQFAVRMVLSGATQFERDNPLVDEFGHALGWSDEQIDELWRTAAAL